MQRITGNGAKLTVWILGLVAVGLALQCLTEPPLTMLKLAEAQVAAESACGDVNGDARLDISDAIYIINWAFRAGPDLVCPEMQICAEKVEQLEKLVAQSQAVIDQQREELARQGADIARLNVAAEEHEAVAAALAAQLASMEAETQKLQAQLAQTQEELERCNRELLECEQP